MGPVSWTSSSVARVPDYTVLSTVNCLKRRVLRDYASEVHWQFSQSHQIDMNISSSLRFSKYCSGFGKPQHGGTNTGWTKRPA